MAISFTDFLESLRADGKLIVSTVIKAAAGRKILTNAVDSPSSLDIDLEDANGDIETVSIPKGAAVDAVARAAAETAQEDIDDHEANHPSGDGGDGTDQVARDAADAAQAEIDQHEADTHNHDTHARNIANAAQAEIDAHETNHPMTPQRVLNQDPNADAGTEGKLQIDPQGNAYTTTPDTEHGTAQTADFARFTHADYIGELSGEPNPLAQTLGTYYFLIVDHKLQVTANNSFGQLRWQDADWSDILATGAGYRGVRGGDAGALSHIQEDGDVYFDRHSDHIRVASNFVAGVTEHINYESKRLARIEEVPEIDPLFVERSTLPAVTEDSPDLVYLSHGHSVGVRADAVISVGFSPSGVAGYSSGEISGILGSINTPSPLAEVFGLGSAADYLLESVYWLNRADLEEFENVWINNISYALGGISVVPGGGAFIRRINNYPTGLATAQVNINFERADESYYYNTGGTEVAEIGLYQKTDNGQGETIYDRVPTESVRHRDQIGPPLIAPNKAGLLDTDDLGRIWSAAGQVFRVLTPPNGDSEVMSLADLGPQYVPDPAGYADLQDRGGIGAWYVERFSHNHVQIQGPALADLVLVLTWIDVWVWNVANITGYNTATFIFNRDETTFLGSYDSEDDALQELQFVLGGNPFPDVDTHQYVVQR